MAEPSNGPGQTKPGKFPTGAVVGGVATIATLGVALSQLVLNGLEIREKAAPVAKAAGLEQVAPDPASTENNAPPPGLSRLQAAGEDPAPTEVAEVAAPAAVPYGQGFRYPSGAEAVALPATVDKQLHALFVALESSLRNRAAYADYRVVFLDPRKLRLLRRPVDDVGTRVALGF
ncbi:MAG TPA: hypothetical protein VEI97_13800, partial [bacterium]|nr:hypothetical protein [bacterium]